MINKEPTKSVKFCENDLGFVARLAVDVGCHYAKANDITYSLNQSDSAVQGEMGTFAWVHKESEDSFWVSTRKMWVKEARARALSGGTTAAIGFLPKDDHMGDSVCLDAREDSYRKTVNALKLIKLVR